jgi:hypothetical protein
MHQPGLWRKFQSSRQSGIGDTRDRHTQAGWALVTDESGISIVGQPTDAAIALETAVQ